MIDQLQLNTAQSELLKKFVIDLSSKESPNPSPFDLASRFVSMDTGAESDISTETMFKWAYEQSVNTLGQDTLISVAGQAQTLLQGMLIFCLSNFLTVLSTVGNIAFQIVLYLTLVYFFLDMDGSIVSTSLRTVIVEEEIRNKIETDLKELIAGLFVMNVYGALLQATYTWILLDFMGVNCVYLYALFTAFFKTVPFASVWLVGLVASI